VTLAISQVFFGNVPDDLPPLAFGNQGCSATDVPKVPKARDSADWSVRITFGLSFSDLAPVEMPSTPTWIHKFKPGALFSRTIEKYGPIKLFLPDIQHHTGPE
jgi:hypothetical protein